jgi:hypothetical protein
VSFIASRKTAHSYEAIFVGFSRTALSAQMSARTPTTLAKLEMFNNAENDIVARHERKVMKSAGSRKGGQLCEGKRNGLLQ